MWALCGFFQILQALVIVREDASTVQKWFNYAPVTVYIMFHPFEDTRTVFDHVFNYDWMLLLSPVRGYYHDRAKQQSLDVENFGVQTDF